MSGCLRLVGIESVGEICFYLSVFSFQLKRSERDTAFYECVPCPKEIRTRTKKLSRELRERRNEHFRKLRKNHKGIFGLKKQEVNDDGWSLLIGDSVEMTIKRNR